ncbi:MAG: DedA family protein [Thermoplasmatales archaeon]|nr:DedA family protein [Thermoplasmatales archaeon]MCW6170637.1 DedA family protein [Thermoplasmatales archaeon]
MYIQILLIIAIILSSISIANGFLHFINPNINLRNLSFGVFEPVYLLGYLGMFILVAFAPLPDYIIVPFYGYLAFAGIFNVYATLFVSVGAMLFLSVIEYFAGRYAGRALLLKGLSAFKIHEEDLMLADLWIEKHGTFSIFLSTFVPYIKTVIALAAGTLKMNFTKFLISNFLGYFIRFVVLLYIGYGSFRILLVIFEGRFFLDFVIADILCGLCLGLIYVEKYYHSKSYRSRTQSA